MSARILVVDDEPDLLLLASITLARAGYAVSEAATGTEALALARETPPDLVVLDHALPDLSGIEVAERLSAAPATADVPIVILSARGLPEDIARGLAAGADRYLVKPFDGADLLANVRELLAARRAG